MVQAIWRLTLYGLLLATLFLAAFACASTPLPPARLTPLLGAIVIELDVPNHQEICIRRFPAALQRYQCFQVGELRATFEDWRVAN